MKKEFLFYQILEKYFENLSWGENRERIYEKDIKNTEEKYNIILPNDYKKFLLQHNVGYVNFSTFDGFLAENIYEKNQNGNIPFFYSLDQINSQIIEEKMNQILDEELEYEELLKMNFFPIACNSGYDSELLIGIGKDNFGKIYYKEYTGCGIESINYLCESFTDFIEGYHLIDDD